MLLFFTVPYRRDCSDIKLLDRNAGSGIYTILPTAGSSLQVYCDMTTDGGSWLVSKHFHMVHMSQQLT